MQQQKKDLIIKIGPVGSGKSSLSIESLGVSPANVIDVDSYSGGFHGCQFKNQRVQTTIKSCRGTVSVENGGGIFFDEEFMSMFNLKGVCAPQELVNFCASFKFPSNRFPGGLKDFESCFQLKWKMCNDLNTPCGKHFKDLKNKFIQQTLKCCEFRVEKGIYHLNYEGKKKLGYFKDKEEMMRIMQEVTERNFAFQVHILLWARAVKIPIHPFIYNCETHKVTLQ